ncbi:MAG: transglutaminase-like domain-containing protein, partial [Mariprofundaceae bacterium]|nr:transglutaminase-like domain-containing protein [Mariprofundaceae bacterium]
AMVSNYRKELNTMFSNIQAIRSAANAAEKMQRAELAVKHLKSKEHKRKSNFDPNHLPNKSEKADKSNKPKVSAEEYALAGFISTPMAQLAANGFTFAKLAGASDPAYLAETAEVKITPAILAKAAALNHDPVAIYNWVRNNLEWLPTWGAMQTSDMTLSTLKGNAMDISSLTIALLRASGIPARYVHGTIDVPRDNLMNWAGGFTSGVAAGNHISSGGIPSASIVRGGTIHRYRMEHVWVEAAIDYYPSRGVINRDADSWISLDASYKLYDHAAVADTSAYDAYSFVTQTQVAFSSKNATTIGTFIANQTAQLDTWINNNAIPEVIDAPIVPIELPHIPSAMQNHIVARGASYGALPSQLGYRIGFSFQTIDQFGFASGGTPLTFPMAELNNEKITVSFRPATPADEATITSLIPSGKITDLSQLPTSLPAYLIKVIPELRVNGVVRMNGGAITLGSDINLNMAITYPSTGTRNYSSTMVAGGYHVAGIIGGTYDNWKAVDVIDGFTTDAYTWSQGNLSSATNERVQGTLYYSGLNSYWAEYLNLIRVQTKTSSSASLLMPTFGMYGTMPNVTYFFGFPRTVSNGDVIMDIPHIGSVTTQLNGGSTMRPFINLTDGLISSMLEHSISEQMFADPAINSEARSAVKAIAVASQQGIPVLYINRANSSIELPKLQLDAITIAEIQNAVASGKEVITTQAKVTITGWVGGGYIIYDPATGDGAYKIFSSLNGGGMTIFDYLLIISLIILLVALVALIVTNPAFLMATVNILGRIVRPLQMALRRGCFVGDTLIYTLSSGMIEIQSIRLGTVVR